MTRLVAHGSYVPLHRLDRKEIGSGAGTRSIASYDEDSTSMAVAAGHRALAAGRHVPTRVLFATSVPAYADRTNATAIFQALGLDPAGGAYDMVGSVRSAVGALLAASDAATLGHATMVIGSDIRTGPPGSADENAGGDAAAALIFAPDGPAFAELIGQASVSAEFLDRWRVPGELGAHVWEERFGESVYVPAAAQAFANGIKAAGLQPADVHRLVVTGLHSRAVASVRKALKPDLQVVAGDYAASIGITGAAHPLLLLVDAVEHARPGDNIVVLVLADGADCLVFRAGELAGRPGSGPTVAAQAAGGRPVGYLDALVWRGVVHREPPRRPDPDRPAAPPSHRRAGWKFGFVASVCRACGTRHLPPQRVCFRCHAVDDMRPEPLAGVTATIKTFTVDHLAFSVAPPVVVAVVDLDGGGALQCELTDVDSATVQVGDRVELTFRCLHTTADGVRDYFWKARPIATSEE